MTEHPILFNRDMVLANLADRKTQTRRLVTPRNSTVNGYPFDKHCTWPWKNLDWIAATFETAGIYGQNDPHFLVPLLGEDGKPEKVRVRPRWTVGDRLWGKETFYCADGDGPTFTGFYRASEPERKVKWKPSIFMRRWQSRLSFEITELRGQRVQEISEEDSTAEGIQFGDPTPVLPIRRGQGINSYRYRYLWDSINGKKAPWSGNPLVWAITYKPVGSEAAA